MAAANPVFSTYDTFYFDPQMHYAQVLAEGRKAKHKHELPHPPLIEDVSCFSGAHFKPAELRRSLEDLKKRRSWKKSLFFFWRNSEKTNKHKGVQSITNRTPQCRGFKSRSGPIYMNDVNHSRACNSSGPSSEPLSGSLTPRTKGDARIPYMSLNHSFHSTTSLPSKSPIYLVT